MKHNQIALIVGIVGLVILGGIYFWANKSSDTPQNQIIPNTSNSQQAEIDALKKTVEDLKNAKSKTVTNTTPTTPVSKDNHQGCFESNGKWFNIITGAFCDSSTSSTTNIPITPQQNIPTPEPSLANIISEWQNRVAIVVCSFTDSSVWQGSALIASVTGYGTTGITNVHVLINPSGITPPISCAVANNLGVRTVGDVGGPQQGVRSNTFFQPVAGIDMAYIKLNNTLIAPTDNGTFDTVGHGKLCNQNDVALGDKIVILGYPADGSQSSITATQGIVSGFDGNYIVTDAKIDHGNSGGVAVLIKNDCYLGIPSSAVVGSIESYGRILKSSLVFGS